MLHASIDDNLINLRSDAIEQPLLQGTDTPMVIIHLLSRNLTGSTKSNDERCGYRATADATLLPTTAHLRLHPDTWPPAKVERPHALGAINLVPGEGHEPDPHPVHINRDLPQRLRGISVERHAFLLADTPNLLERLHDADLVVDGHDGDEPGVWADGVLELREVDQAVAAHGEVGDLESFLLQVAAGVEDALVLGLRGDDVAAAVAVEAHDALDGDVVALGGAGGEEDLARVGADEGGDAGARGLDGGVGLPAVEVGAGVRVAVAGEVEGEHGVEDARVHGGGGLHVHVERAAGDADALDGDGLLVLLRGGRRRRGRGSHGEVRAGSGEGAAAEEEWEEAAGEGHGLELGAAAAEEQLPFRRRGDLGIAGKTDGGRCGLRREERGG